MTLGPLFFGQPLALFGLLALPLIWWLLRATPPSPQTAELPSLALLQDLDPREETPDQTPWWIIALRFMAAALAILGFAKPAWQPVPPAGITEGPVLIIVDDGWTSAPNWRALTRTTMAAIEDAADAGLATHLVFTAPQAQPQEIGETLTPATARRRLQSVKPSSWAPDRMALFEQLQDTNLAPKQVIWASDGLDHGHASDFTNALMQMAPLEVRPVPPRSAFRIISVTSSPEGATVTVRRARTGDMLNAFISAESQNGVALASAEAVFGRDDLEAIAPFSLPAAALNQIARFKILGVNATGAVHLWDDTALTPTIALADPVRGPQPLLEEFYYVRKALEPHARIVEGPLTDNRFCRFQ